MVTQGHRRRIIRVTPTLSTDAYAQGDVLFVATEIPHAVMGKGECSRLLAAFCLSQAHSNADDLDVYFTEANTALGTINATANISDEDMEAIGVNMIAKLDADQGSTSTSIDTSRIYPVLSLTGSSEGYQPLGLIQAAAGSTNVYVSGLLTSGTTPTYAAYDIDLIFHIQYK